MEGGEKMKANRVEQHIIPRTHKFWSVIDDLCFKTKNVYNCANFIIRQEFIKNNKWLRNNEVDKIMQQYDCYYELGSQASQKVIQLLDKCWVSFFKGIKGWSENKDSYLGKPRIPQYKDKIDGRCVLMLKNIQCKIVDGYLKFSWKPLRELKVKSNVIGKLIQVRFVPRGKNYVLEIVYEIDTPECNPESKRIIGIDLGIDNFATVSNNINQRPFLINGRAMKSMNQYYNKKKAEMQSELKRKHDRNWSNKLQHLTDKRFNKVKDYMHRSSKYIIGWCIDNQIDTVVVGLNKSWKQEANMGSRNNQNFITIPFEMFISQLKYKCENVGIKFIETEESYTSGTSFLDGELPNKKDYDKSRRKARGLFTSNKGIHINADLNGAYQIVKKVFPNTFMNGIEDAGLHPVRVNLI